MGGGRHPSDVAAWLGEARDQPTRHGVDDSPHDDRDRAGGLLERPDISGIRANEKIRFETHELRCEGSGALFQRPGRIPALDHEVLAQDIPVLPQPFHPLLPVRTLP